MISKTDWVKEKTNEELFALYQKEKSLEIRQELTMRYLYIVKAIAVQMQGLYSGSMQMDDVINEGVIAIMKGIDRYDPNKDNKFETFISRRIRGMVIDLVRKNDWMPRDYHRQNRSIEEGRSHLTEKLGRQPSDEEIADYLQMDFQRYLKIRNMSTMLNVLSLDFVMENSEDRQAVQIADMDQDNQPERVFLKEETLQTLVQAINTLKEKEKLVISLYYVEELNMNQIAQMLAVSGPRISQIHSTAIRKLRDYMTSHL